MPFCQFPGFPGVAGDAAGNEVRQRGGQDVAQGINGGRELDQQARIFAPGQNAGDGLAGCLGAAAGFVTQLLDVAIVREGGLDRGKRFRQENIPVACVAQCASKGFPGLPVGIDELCRQDRCEKFDGRAQAAQCNTRLMHELEIIVAQQTGFITLEIFQAA